MAWLVREDGARAVEDVQVQATQPLATAAPAAEVGYRPRGWAPCDSEWAGCRRDAPAPAEWEWTGQWRAGAAAADGLGPVWGGPKAHNYNRRG